MRLAPALALLLLAGCFTPPSDVPPTATTPATQDGAGDAGTGNATTEAPPPVGERAEASVEVFALAEGRTLRVVRAGDPELPMAHVPETVAPTALYQSFAQGISLTPWTSEPFRSSWESTGDLEISLSFMSDAPATATQPKASGFPAVGAWLGTTERYAFFLLATDAPDTLEAGKVYSVKLVAKPPQGGSFVREGEQLALYSFLTYQTADGGPVNYVIGGPTPSSVRVPHAHFNVTAPRATVILEKSGELPPNPGPTGDMMQDPPMLEFSVPADAVFLFAEVSGAPKVGTRADIDLAILSPGGDVISGGSSPRSTEVVAIGPGNLEAYGRSLVARITGSVIPAGGTFSVKVTAYSP